jgi:hypothetical protein
MSSGPKSPSTITGLEALTVGLVVCSPPSPAQADAMRANTTMTMSHGLSWRLT